TMDERRSVGCGLRMHHPDFSRRSTAWLLPPTVITSAWAISNTRHDGAESMISITLKLPRLSPASRCSRSSTAAHSSVSYLTRSSNTCRRSAMPTPFVDYRPIQLSHNLHCANLHSIKLLSANVFIGDPVGPPQPQ